LISFVAFVLLWALLVLRLVCISNITGREVFKLMGRVLGLSLCENMPLGIPLASGFFKLLAIDGLFPEHPTLEDLAEMDQGLHRSLAVALPSMPAMELREALQCLTFSVPSRTQSQAAVTSSRVIQRAQVSGGFAVGPICSDVRSSRFMAQPPTQPPIQAAEFESPLRPGVCVWVCECVCCAYVVYSCNCVCERK